MKAHSKGCYVGKWHALAFFVLFASSVTACGLLVYFFAGRAYSHDDDHTTTASPVSPTITTTQKPVVDVRLPRSLIPSHYDIRLLPIVEKGNFSFFGDATISVRCDENTNKIVMHSADLVVDQASITIVNSDTKENVLRNGTGIILSHDAELEFLIIELRSSRLNKGTNYQLTIKFTGVLNDQLRGFYRSSYVEDGVERYLATTQMEPVDARRAFPCFDEPNMKAEFTITLGRHKSMRSMSNMPLISTTAIDGMDGYYWDRFARSVPMSTYLVAMIVADFSKVDALDNSNWKFSIYARPSAESQTKYANEIGPKILSYYEDYFNISYPLPKQDMIAIPDFSAGAMENWGLITYRESSLLYDERLSAAVNKQRVAVVIAHELAHQWFGDLVTMDWWSDLWLNEGFASYMEYVGTNHVEPTFGMFEQIVSECLHGVMVLDSLESSHPISVVVRHPDEINELFDHISYSKGASIIRMLNGFIGEKSFRYGLSSYLRTRQYKNAVQDDLWDAFTKQTRIDGVELPATVKEIMDSWTLKMGFPVVTVERDYGRNSARVTQKRFLQNMNSTSDDGIVYLWWVPLTYTKDFVTVVSDWISDKSSAISVGNLSAAKDEWVVFNVGQIGYYRVNYDTHNWNLIYQQLMSNYTAIPVINRAQMMDDSLNLAKAGLLDYGIALNLTRYLEKEDQFLPWSSALDSLQYVDSMLSRKPGYGLFKEYLRKILIPLYDMVQFNDSRDDPHLMTYVRMSAVSWACHIDYDDCVKNSVQLYRSWMQDPDNLDIISPNLKRTVACTAIRKGGTEEWDFAFQRYTKTNVASEKDILLAAMGCSEQAWILSRYLEWSLNSTSGIRKQDGGSVFRHVSNNPLGRYIAFDFFRNNWNELKAYFSTLSNLGRMVDSVTFSFNTEQELKELKQFQLEHKSELSTAARTIQQSIDRAANNVLWMKENYQKVVNWLEEAN